MANAQIKMKALVVSRLLMGDMPDWRTFESEHQTADKITNRAIARNVSSQIGRRYRELSAETQRFIERNFVQCDYHALAHLCDEVKAEGGLSVRLDEFERKFFPLAESVKRRFPFYAHVSISAYGLQFEFPEHHFLRDIETSLPELLDIKSRLLPFIAPDANPKRDRDLISGLIARERFLSRSVVSAAFSLVEAFASGLFYTAVHTNSYGSLTCDEDFLKYARTKESAPLRDRLDRIVKLASRETEGGADEPFATFIEVGKRYRDAIHHTTPFERKDIKAGGRLTALYEIDGSVALRCVFLSCATVLRICQWAFEGSDTSDIARRCEELVRSVTAVLPNKEARGAAA